MGEKSWKWLVAQPYDFFSLVETHIHDSTSLRTYDGKARGKGLRLHVNPARRSDKRVADSHTEYASEGGEWFMSKSHLRAASLSATRAASAKLQAPNHPRSLDGFVAVTVHFAGYSMVVVTFYAHDGAGVRGSNAGRYQRLAGLLWSLQLPWIVIGDFNISPKNLLRSGIPDRLHSRIITAGEDVVTCNLGSGTVIDYIMCSASAVPFIVSVSPVQAVPWKPHIGLEVVLRSTGEQLITRVLEAPGRLPQVSKPQAQPTPGSKSSQAKLKRQLQSQIAAEKRASKFSSLFHDCCDKQSACAKEGEREPGDTDHPSPDSREHIDDEGLDYSEWPDEYDPWAEELNFCSDKLVARNLSQQCPPNSCFPGSSRSVSGESGEPAPGVAEVLEAASPSTPCARPLGPPLASPLDSSTPTVGDPTTDPVVGISGNPSSEGVSVSAPAYHIPF